MWYKCRICNHLFNDTGSKTINTDNLYSLDPVIYCPECGTDETMLIQGELCSICGRFIDLLEQPYELGNKYYCNNCKKELEEE